VVGLEEMEKTCGRNGYIFVLDRY
jgi:hypothetical protein